MTNFNNRAQIIRDLTATAEVGRPTLARSRGWLIPSASSKLFLEPKACCTQLGSNVVKDVRDWGCEATGAGKGALPSKASHSAVAPNFGTAGKMESAAPSTCGRRWQCSVHLKASWQAEGESGALSVLGASLEGRSQFEETTSNFNRVNLCRSRGRRRNGPAIVARP
jgi:hypothetical protein